MRLYWSLKTVPEFQALPADERLVVARQSAKLATRTWQLWASLAAVLVVSVPCALVASGLISRLGLAPHGVLGNAA